MTMGARKKNNPHRFCYAVQGSQIFLSQLGTQQNEHA
jgi:hypothetical protein